MSIKFFNDAFVLTLIIKPDFKNKHGYCRSVGIQFLYFWTQTAICNSTSAFLLGLRVNTPKQQRLDNLHEAWLSCLEPPSQSFHIIMKVSCAWMWTCAVNNPMDSDPFRLSVREVGKSQCTGLTSAGSGSSSGVCGTASASLARDLTCNARIEAQSLLSFTENGLAVYSSVTPKMILIQVLL